MSVIVSFVNNTFETQTRSECGQHSLSSADRSRSKEQLPQSSQYSSVATICRRLAAGEALRFLARCSTDCSMTSTQLREIYNVRICAVHAAYFRLSPQFPLVVQTTLQAIRCQLKYHIPGIPWHCLSCCVPLLMSSLFDYISMTPIRPRW